MTPPTDPHVGLLDDARHEDALADRTTRRLLVEADDAVATFRSSLAAAAEHAGTVLVETTVGRRFRGRVGALAADHVLLDGGHGAVWLRVDAIVLARAIDGTALRAAVLPHRPAPLPLTEVLLEHLEHREEVEAVLDGGVTARGVLVAVGRDVLTLRSSTGELLLLNLDRVAVLVVPSA